LGVACSVWAACAERAPTPWLDRVEPSVVTRLAATPALVRGGDLLDGVEVSLDETPPAFDHTWSARVGGVDVGAVVRLDVDRLGITLPAGLALGTHDLEVTTPEGAELILAAAITVVEAPTGRPIGTSTVSQADSATFEEGVIVVADDPLGDGTDFAEIAVAGGYVYLGPSSDGAAAARFLPDGTAAESVSFDFPADTSGGTQTRNNSPPPYPSIGAAGCAPDTAACGPDNEHGRGSFGSVTIAGVDWLVIAGARSNNFEYVYMTPDLGPALSFRYDDLGELFGGNTRSVSALHVFADRVYLGSPDAGGSRPYLIALATMPGVPGLDADDGIDAFDLEAGAMPGFQLTSSEVIDAIADFGDRLYIANHGGWMRSTVTQPRSYDDFPSDWSVCTPSAGDYTARTSIATTKTASLFPSDRSVPQLASHGGRLHVARNTTAGPQLWACAPATTADATACDPGDWSLVAANTTGDLALTQFDNPANTAITMLVATESALYVGFDNATDGVVVFRSAAATPATQADFTGDAACSAALHPGSCAGLGGNGLGDPADVQRIWDGEAVPLAGGGSEVVMVAGRVGAPAQVYRMEP
jgi:hypothetical protein